MHAHRELLDHAEAMSALLQLLRAGVLVKVCCGTEAAATPDGAVADGARVSVGVAARGGAEEEGGAWGVPIRCWRWRHSNRSTAD